MPYCSLKDLISASSESEMNRLLDTNNDGSHDQARLSDAIANADAIIDGYLAAKYGFPLNVAPELVPLPVRAISADITRYRLWSEGAPEEVRNRYKDAVGQLKDYARGIMVLVDVPESTLNVGGGVDVYAEERVFTRDTLAGY